MEGHGGKETLGAAQREREDKGGRERGREGKREGGRRERGREEGGREGGRERGRGRKEGRWCIEMKLKTTLAPKRNGRTVKKTKPAWGYLSHMTSGTHKVACASPGVDLLFF